MPGAIVPCSAPYESSVVEKYLVEGGSTRTRRESVDTLCSCTGSSYTPPASYATKCTFSGLA
jgi:hypothetical protein